MKPGEPKAKVGDTIQVKARSARVHRGQRGTVRALHRRSSGMAVWNIALGRYVIRPHSLLSYEVKFGEGEIRRLGSGEFEVIIAE